MCIMSFVNYDCYTADSCGKLGVFISNECVPPGSDGCFIKV